MRGPAFRIALACTLAVLASHVDASLRGVHPQQAALYSGASISCSGKTIPISNVNDEFCDCEVDGLDEPGTSACKNAQFYCVNVGYRGQFLFSSNVNDGVCDCCDGSDEYSSGAVCVNTCDVLGESVRKQYMGEASDIDAGIKAREQMIAAAHAELAEKNGKIEALKNERDTQQALVDRLRSVKDEIEAVEKAERDARDAEEAARKAAEAAAQPSPPADAPPADAVPSTATAAEGSQDTAAAAVAESAAAENAAAFPYPKEYMAPQAAAADVPAPAAEPSAEPSAAFPYPAEYMPQDAAASPSAPVSDEAPAVFEDDAPPEVAPAATADLSAPPPPPPQDSAAKVVMHTADDGELGDRDADSTSGRLEWLTSGAALSELVSIADRALSSLGALFHSTSVAAESVSTRAHEFTPSPTAPPAVAVERTAAQVAADQARSEHSAADARLSTLNREITDIETYAGLDFGPDRALAALHKKCVSLEVRQYTYEVCFFDKVTQKEGYSSTSLGVWTKSDDVHREMRFENGQGCWNGPARSAQVSLSCGPPPADGAVARVLSVDEPSKCVYAIKVSTPAACLPELVEQTRKQMQDALAVDLRPKGHALKDEL